jgi:hypothetical protein
LLIILSGDATNKFAALRLCLGTNVGVSHGIAEETAISPSGMIRPHAGQEFVDA